MNEKIIKLEGANLDIDLISQDMVKWKQSECPWNKEERANEHKCAVKNISICKYFCGVKYLDTVLCSYPYENSDILRGEEITQI